MRLERIQSRFESVGEYQFIAPIVEMVEHVLGKNEAQDRNLLGAPIWCARDRMIR